MAISCDQIAPGMTLDIGGKIYRVESCTQVAAKANPFVKVRLLDLVSDKVIEKNFKLNQKVEEVFLLEHTLEFLYPEKKGYLFLDVNNLEQILVPSERLEEKIQYLKEGITVKAVLFGTTIFSIELPQFLELMVIKAESVDETTSVSGSTKKATLETGAVIDVPLFTEAGDIVKVDTYAGEYIQRI